MEILQLSNSQRECKEETDMKKITCVHTGMGGLPTMIETVFKSAIGEAQFHHILDSGLVGDIIEANGVTPQLEKRLYALFDAAATTDADVIVATCSSIGEVTRKYAAEHPEVNLLSIDYPMAKYAAEHGNKVGILATLSTTVEPSANLVKQLVKEAGREVEVVQAVAPGAFQAIREGNQEKASELVVKTAQELCADADIILLAQASMASFKTALAEALGKGVEFLESPSTCAVYLK